LIGSDHRSERIIFELNILCSEQPQQSGSRRRTENHQEQITECGNYISINDSKRHVIC